MDISCSLSNPEFVVTKRFLFPVNMYFGTDFGFLVKFGLRLQMHKLRNIYLKKKYILPENPNSRISLAHLGFGLGDQPLL